MEIVVKVNATASPLMSLLNIDISHIRLRSQHVFARTINFTMNCQKTCEMSHEHIDADMTNANISSETVDAL